MGLHRGEDSTLSRVEEVLVNDGDWHHLQLDISSLGGAGGNHKAVLSVDQGLYQVNCYLTSQNFCSDKQTNINMCKTNDQASMEVDGELQDSKLKTVSLGGLARPDGKVLHGFRGCIQVCFVNTDLTQTGAAVPLSFCSTHPCGVCSFRVSVSVEL